jgi:pimeloyl-ACP methyl ester carboxylesterase
VGRPRLLLVPEFTELAWVIKPRLEEWGEVASYDPPRAPGESFATLDHEAVAERGLVEWDERGWDSCFIAGDSWAVATAVRIAAARPERVLGLALGHAALSQRRDGDRAPISEAVWSGMTEMLRTDSQAFIANAMVQLTRGSYDEALIQRALALFGGQDLEAGWRTLTRPDVEFGGTLAELGVPLLLARHEGCLLHTEEGYEDAVAAFPDARTVVTEGACCTDPRFAEALREFCEELAPSAKT